MLQNRCFFALALRSGFRALISAARSFIMLLCNSVSAGHSGVAASMFLAGAAACLIEGSLEVKLPTIWRDEKQSRAEAERRERLEERRSEEIRVRRQKIQMREKVGKSRNTVFFQWFVAPEGRKVGSLKRRVRSQLATGAMKNCTPLWREAHFEVKSVKNWRSRTTFGSWDVKKVHAVVARSTFPSQNVQNTPASDHFWKSRCWKSARRCGAKHILKSKCTKHTRSGPLLEVEMSKKCTPLWREAHFEVKMYKTHHSRTTFGGSDVEKVHAVVARSTFPSQNVKNTRGLDHFWRFRCLFASLHYNRRHHTTLHSTTLHYTPQHYNYNNATTLHYTPLHQITLHYTTLHYTTLHYTTLPSTTLDYITLHYTTLHYITLHYTALYYNYNCTTTLHYTTLHYTTLHYLPLHLTTLHYITLHYTPLHYNYNYTTTLHYTPLH